MVTITLGDLTPGVSAVLKPSVAVTSGSAIAFTSLDALMGPHGLTRFAIENVLGFSTSLSNFSSSLRTATLNGVNLGSILQHCGTMGTCSIGIWKMPLWLSTSADSSSAGASGWLVYQTAHPSDFSVWQLLCADVATWLYTELKIRPAQFIGDPGWMIEGWNEIDLDQFWGYPGTGSHLVDAFETWRRMRAGVQSVAPTAICLSPSLSSESATHYSVAAVASWSANVVDVTISAGGTESTGRVAARPMRSVWKFPTTIYPGTRGYPGESTVTAHLGVQFNTRNIDPSAGISADTWSYYPWNSNGQGDPQVATAANLFNLVSAGTPYVTGSTAWRATGDNTIQIALGATAKTHLDSCKSGATTYSVGVLMAAENSGADREARPLGYDQSFALASWKPAIRLALDEPVYTTFARYCSGLGISDWIANVHHYESTPGESAASVATVGTLLANAGVSARPVVITEWNDWHSFPSAEPDRDSEKGAAWVARTLFAQRRAGLAGSCKYNLVDNSGGNEFKGDFGYFTQANSIPKPSWLVQAFLANFARSTHELPVTVTSTMSALGIDAYGAILDGQIALIVVRYHSAGVTDSVLVTLPSGYRLIQYSVERVNSTLHNSQGTFNATAGSTAVKAAAATAAMSLAFPVTAATSIQLPLEKFEVSLVLADVTRLPIGSRSDAFYLNRPRDTRRAEP